MSSHSRPENTGTGRDPQDLENLGRTAASGGRSTLVLQLLRIAIQFGGAIALSRLLSPAEFGSVAIVLAIAAAGEVIREFGLSYAVVQARQISHNQRSNLFWINTGLGLVLSFGLLLGAKPLADAFSNSSIEQAATVIAPIFLINGLCTQARAHLMRNMRFTALGLSELAGAAFGLGVAVCLAIAGLGVTALALQQTATVALIAAISLWLDGWIPSRPRRGVGTKPFLLYARGNAGTQVLGYVSRNVDTLALAQFSSVGQVGLYSRGFQLILMPIQQLLAPMTRVALPILSRIHTDTDRFQKYVLYGQQTTGLVVASGYALFIGIADPLIPTALGSQWTDLIPIAQVLAIGGVFRALSQPIQWVLLATGKTDHLFRLSLVAQPLIWVALIAGAYHGAMWLAVSHSVAYFLYWVGGTIYACAISGLRSSQLLGHACAATLIISMPIGLSGYVLVSTIDSAVTALALAVLAALAIASAAMLLPTTESRLFKGLILKSVRRSS